MYSLAISMLKNIDKGQKLCMKNLRYIQRDRKKEVIAIVCSPMCVYIFLDAYASQGSTLSLTY